MVPGATIAHLGIAVPDLASAIPFYRDLLGLEPGRPERADGATIVAFPAGAAAVELLEPSDPAGPVARFLARRGPGIHHVCFRVPDLDGAMARCRALGYRLVDEHPRPGTGGHRIAFLHPRSTAGILIELTE